MARWGSHSDGFALDASRGGPADAEDVSEDLCFWVRTAPRGDDDTVTVYEDESGQIVLKHAVRNWLHLNELGAEYGVPPERWTIDDDARAVLDANS